MIEPTPSRPSLQSILEHISGTTAAFRERLFTKPTRYDSVLWPDAASDLAGIFGNDADAILSEPALRNVEERTRSLLRDIRNEDPFRNHWASDSILARCCYLVCRLIRPEVVIETGVAYGVSSAFILAALKQNGSGVLHSVDLLPLRRRAALFQGIAVPDEDHPNWTLHHGSSRRVLSGLLSGLGGADFFLHDSLHTKGNMQFEFDLALRHLRSGGVLLADDIERNDAFSGLQRSVRGFSTVIADREQNPLHGRPAPTVFGIAVPEPPDARRYNPPA